MSLKLLIKGIILMIFMLNADNISFKNWLKNDNCRSVHWQKLAFTIQPLKRFK